MKEPDAYEHFNYGRPLSSGALFWSLKSLYVTNPVVFARDTAAQSIVDITMQFLHAPDSVSRHHDFSTSDLAIESFVSTLPVASTVRGYCGYI